MLCLLYFDTEPSFLVFADGKGKVEEIPLHDECIAPGCDDMPLTRAILDPRDPQILNSHVVVQFDEVIGETDVPGRTHEGVFNCSRATFLFCQKYFYMVLATLCAGPSALCLGMQYAWMAFLHIWCCSPRVRLFRICMLMMRKFYSAVVHCMCDPCAEVVVLAVKSVKKWHVACLSFGVMGNDLETQSRKTSKQEYIDSIHASLPSANIINMYMLITGSNGSVWCLWNWIMFLLIIFMKYMWFWEIYV